MLSVQPIFSLSYFRFKRNKLARDLKRLFYLSWEDALWDILSKKDIPLGSYILVPEFFCPDVENNIRLHGWKTVSYKLDNKLKVVLADFQEKIAKYKPRTIVILHPVGIKSNLFTDTNRLGRYLGDALLIEDAVHRVIDPEKLEIISDNHFIINSLRKVVPLQGAEVFAKCETLNFKTPAFFQSFTYRAKVNLLWFLMTLFFTLANYLPEKLSKIFAIVAEKLMLAGYELIGDSLLPSRGGIIEDFLSRRLNLVKIKNNKKQMFLYYQKMLKGLVDTPDIAGTDESKLRGYPVILARGRAEKILKFVRDRGLRLRLELEDSDWSKLQKIIYLPMGLYMSPKKQKLVADMINEALRVNL